MAFICTVVSSQWGVGAPAPPAGRPKEIASFQAHRFRVYDLAFSPEGRILASTGDRGNVKLWDTTDWKNLADISSHLPDGPRVRGIVRNVAFSPDGKIVACWGDDRKIRLWDVRTGHRVGTLDEVGLDSFPLAFSPSGETLLCGSSLIDLKTKESRLIVDRPRGFLRTGSFDPKGKLLFATAGGWTDSPCIRLWDTKTGQIYATCQGLTAECDNLAFSRDGKVIASTTRNHGLRIWDVATGRNKATFKDCPGRHCALVFNPDGSILAVGYKHQEADGKSDASPPRESVRLYETSTGRVLATLEGQPGPIAPLAFSPNGRLLASGSFNGIITIWSLPRRFSDEKEDEKKETGK
jgi:WD40 repeat protein